MMTAYELRKHLADAHDTRMGGADYGTLLAVHELEHQERDPDHTHEADEA